MQVKILLNHVEKHKGFVYDRVRLVGTERPRLVVDIRPRAGSKPLCSKCDKPGPCYDTQPVRHFQFVPLWGFTVMFAYCMRRVNCPECGVKVETVPWAVGKSPTTTTYAWFLANWAKRMSWKEVADTFHTSWDTVFRAVALAVAWGLEHRDLKGIRAIGVDEVLWHRGHKYLTVVYQIDEHCRRLLWVGRDRTTETLNTFFNEFGLRARWLRWVCSDMWKPYLGVISRRAKNAVHVLDRFHIVAKMNKAIDEVRAGEARQMKRDGHEPLLKHSRCRLLKRPENRARGMISAGPVEGMNNKLKVITKSHAGRPLSHAGSTSRPEARPQILLTTQKVQVGPVVFFLAAQRETAILAR